MSGTRTRRRWAGAAASIASALALVAAILTFGPATGVGSAATGTGAHAAASTSSGSTICAPSGEGGTTCTGTFSGDTAWDNYLGPNVNGGTDGTVPGGGEVTAAPQVTVDQTVGLTDQIVHVSWSNFTPSGYEGSGPACDATPVLQLCNGYTQGQEFYPVFVLQCAANVPTDLADVDTACNDLQVGEPSPGAPGTKIESYTRGGTTTHATDCSQVAVTDTVCGTGFADMQVQSKVVNQTLGCDSTSPCNLVVVPNWGGVSDGNPADCEGANHLQDLWWGNSTAEDGSAEALTSCAWNDRITVPLSFAPTPREACNSTKTAFTAAGSPLLERVMEQWQPGWCTGTSGTSKVNFGYNSTMNEYEARQAFLSGSGGSSLTEATDVALVTDPPGSGQSGGSSVKFTYAPIETAAISVAFYVDSQTAQEPVTDIKLDARLLAKLLTESYALSLGQCGQGQTTQADTCDPAIQGNPTSIFTDPEFYKLNPEYTEADFANVGPNNQGGFLPIVMSGNTDMTYELTRWIAADPDALAFLEGAPDPWGMHVNRYYAQGQSQTYPTSQFEVLDPGFTATDLQVDNGAPYLGTMQEAWDPLNGLDNVATHLANWTASGFQFNGTCTVSSNECGVQGGNLFNAKDAAQNFPERDLFAVMDAGTAAAYRFPTAQLVNPAGNAVAPTAATMTAAVNAMKTNPDGITQYQDFSNTAANAYPLTEVQYAMVPTCGLTTAKANGISTFLRDVASSQNYGVGLGQIPSSGGYLALTAKQQAQTLTASQQVGTQSCTSSKPDTSVGGGNPPAGSGSGNNNGSGSGTGTGTGNAPSSAANPTGKPSAYASASASASATPIGLGDKAADTSNDMKYILPAALAAGALLALGGPLAYGYGTTGGFRFRIPRRRGTHGPGGPDGGDVDG